MSFTRQLVNLPVRTVLVSKVCEAAVAVRRRCPTVQRRIAN
jgi:hypothetical protein